MEKLLIIFHKLNKKGFFHLIISNYSIQLIVFSSHLLIAKIMTPNEVGIIKTIETFTGIAIVLGGGGSIFAILKLVPENKNTAIRSYLLKYSLKYTATFSLAVFLLFYILTFYGVFTTEDKTLSWLYLYSWIIIPTVLMQLLVRYYQAIDFFKRISTVIFYLKLISAAIVLGYTYFFFINGYILSMIITSSISLLMLVYDLRKDIFVKSTETFSYLKDSFLKLSKTAFISQIVDQLKLHSGFLIAYILITDNIEFGHYSFALILVQGMNVLVTSVQQFIIPKMSESTSNIKLFFIKYNLYTKRFNYFSILLFLIAQIIIPFLIFLIYGDKYDDAILLLRIMLVGWLIQALHSLTGVIFLSLGKMKFILYSSFMILILSSPVMYFLTLKYGAVGAAYSFVVHNIASYIFMTYFTRRITKKSLNI